MGRAARAKLYLFLILVSALGLTAHYLVPVSARFNDTETIRCSFTAGTWEAGPSARICKVCPDWGLAGACRWPLFIYGEGFSGRAQAKLVNGDLAIPAVKTLVLSRSMAYAVFNLQAASWGKYDVRLDFQGGGSAVLYGGFTVLAWQSCGYYATCEQTTGKEGASAWEKAMGHGGPGAFALVARKRPGVGISSAYAVAPGILLKGTITMDEKGRPTILFDLGSAPQTRYDVVLLTPGDLPILLEGIIAPEDVIRVKNTEPPSPAPPAPPAVDTSTRAPVDVMVGTPADALGSESNRGPEERAEDGVSQPPEDGGLK